MKKSRLTFILYFTFFATYAQPMADDVGYTLGYFIGMFLPFIVLGFLGYVIFRIIKNKRSHRN